MRKHTLPSLRRQKLSTEVDIHRRYSSFRVAYVFGPTYGGRTTSCLLYNEVSECLDKTRPVKIAYVEMRGAVVYMYHAVSRELFA